MSSTLNHNLLLLEKVLLLKSLSIFKETPETILSELAPLMKEEQLESDTIIFEENDPGDCMYIILSGKISIRKGNQELAVLKENEVFGELSLLDNEPRSAAAIAKTDCMLYKIDHEPFYELLDTRPEIARGFIKILCNRLRQLNERTTKGS
jgi:CRP/FNR family transcriptional regulator, cyclic AMP receptor protein